jgi:cobalamin biosynthesis Mg chelatase CobN
MNTWSHRLLAVALFSLFSGTALANPIAIIMRLSAEVTGSTHVRLRYLTNYGSNPNLITYGTGHSEWFSTGDTISLDAGSGARTMTYQYMCDCHVPTGSPLTYQVLTSMSGGFSPSFPAELTATVTPAASPTTLCDEKCAQVDSRDAGADSTGAATGGSTGSNTATGGATAASTATSVPSAGGTSAVASTESGAGGSSPSVASTSAAGGNTSTPTNTEASEERKSGGSCSFSSYGRGGALSLLLALGLMAVGWRRRR